MVEEAEVSTEGRDLQERLDAIARNESGPHKRKHGPSGNNRYSPEVRAQVAIDALEIGATEVTRRWSSGGWHITQKSSHWSNTDSMLEYLQEV